MTCLPRLPILRARPLAVVLACLLGLAAGDRQAAADSTTLGKDGALYEVFVAPYQRVVPGNSIVPGLDGADYLVVALRSTASDGTTAVEVVDGTLTPTQKGAPSVEVDDVTGTLLVCYSTYQGVMSDLHVSVKRNGQWVGRDIQPNSGLYLSLHPKLTSTRQRYLDWDGKGGKVSKWRTIFSLVWWEESGTSQARYAPIFVEDGVVGIDNVTAYNLNDLMGKAGPTPAGTLPFSAYMFPSVQPDPSSTNGGILLVFANLATKLEQVISITFPDDLTTGGVPGTPGGLPDAQVRAHVPIGRGLADGQIPAQRDTQADVGYFLTPSGRATSFWSDVNGVHYLRNDAAGAEPMRIKLRPDFPIDRALTAIREMTLKN